MTMAFVYHEYPHCTPALSVVMFCPTVGAVREPSSNGSQGNIVIVGRRAGSRGFGLCFLEASAARW